METGKKIGWLRCFGVEPATLDPETLEVAKKLGKEGVQKLIKEGVPPSHRGSNNLVKQAENLARVAQTGTLEKWTGPGARKVRGDKPADWINEEWNQVLSKIF